MTTAKKEKQSVDIDDFLSDFKDSIAKMKQMRQGYLCRVCMQKMGSDLNVIWCENETCSEYGYLVAVGIPIKI